jgi:hypothetical protein
MRRRARIAAIRIVTAEGPSEGWDTFNTGLADLERTAHRLGASHMPDEYQHALHLELRRELVDSINAVLGPWREAQLRAGMTGVDQWERSFAAWAAHNPEAAAAWTVKTAGKIEKSTDGDSGDYVPEAPHPDGAV